MDVALTVALGDLCHLDESFVGDVFYWHLQSQGEKVGLLLNDETASFQGIQIYPLPLFGSRFFSTRIQCHHQLMQGRRPPHHPH